jgi:hypothetical protein
MMISDLLMKKFLMKKCLSSVTAYEMTQAFRSTMFLVMNLNQLVLLLAGAKCGAKCDGNSVTDVTGTKWKPQTDHFDGVALQSQRHDWQHEENVAHRSMNRLNWSNSKADDSEIPRRFDQCEFLTLPSRGFCDHALARRSSKLETLGPAWRWRVTGTL